MTAGAWDDIPSLTLSKSSLKLLGTGHRIITETSDDNAEEQTISCEELTKQLDNNLSDSDISDWIGADSCDPSYQVLTDQDIVEQVTSMDTQPSTENDPDSESEDSSCDIPTNGETMEMLDKCLAWYECQSDATPTSTMLLKRI